MALTEPRSPRGSKTEGFLSRIWGAIVRGGFAPHVSVTDVGERRRAQLTMGLALALMIVDLAGLLASLGLSNSDRSVVVFAGLVIVSLAAYGLGRTRFYMLGAILLPVGLSLSALGLILAGSDDISVSLYSTLPLAIVIASGLLPLGGLVALVLVNVVFSALLPLFVSGMSMANTGRDAGVLLSIGVLVIVITAFRNSLESVRLRQWRTANEELTDIQETLEQRVDERTIALEQRSAYLSASAEIGQSVGSILDDEQLIRQVVELIRERFVFYYVGLFLVDETREWANLRAGTGEAGQKMIARGHRLRVDANSMIGWAITNAQARIALQADQDEVRAAATELPETRSEAALPLRSRGQVLGALTVQSNRPGVFDEDMVAALQTMADQVAVALDNARLFAESQAALDAERRAYGDVSRQAWAGLLRARGDAGYRYEHGTMQPAESRWSPDMIEAVQTAAVVRAETDDGPTLAVPLQVRGRVVGSMRVAKGQAGTGWSAEEVALLQSVSEQLGQALEGARLYQDTQQRAARERLIGQVTGRVRESLDMEAMLRVATSEIRRALGLDKVVVRLAGGPGLAGDADTTHSRSDDDGTMV